METTGGVGDHEVRAPSDGGVERVVDAGTGLRAGGMGDALPARAVGPDLKLIDGGRPERVGRSEQDAPTGPRIPRRELADRRRLAGAVDADDQDDRRSTPDDRPR